MRKSPKIILSLLLCFAMLFSLSAFCFASGGLEYAYSEMGNSKKLLGRALMVDDKVHMAMSASGAEANIICSGKVTLKYIWTANPGYLGVFVDGEYTRYANTVAKNGETRTLVIAQNLEQGEHSIKVVKCNEFHDAEGNLLNIIDLVSLSFEGTLGSAPKNDNLKIEFYGDSLTAAMGNLGTNSTTLTSQNYGLNQDIYDAYAYYTASYFGADFSVMASSGEGIIKGYGNDDRNTWSALHSYADPYNKIEWNDSDFDADVVVINLGANDTFNKALNYCEFTDKEFSEMAYKILEYVYSYNPDCKVIWLFPLPQLVMDYLYEACYSGIELATQCFDNCYFYAMTPEDYGVTNVDDYLDGMDISNIDYNKLSSFLEGASSHPSAKQHHFYSNTLIKLINETYYAKEFVVDDNGCLTQYNGQGGDIIVPDNVKSISDRVFRNVNVNSITVPESTVKFGNNIFPINPDLIIYCFCNSPAISKYANTEGITLSYSHKYCTYDFPEKIEDGNDVYIYAHCSKCGDEYVPVCDNNGKLEPNAVGNGTLVLKAPNIDCVGASLRIFDENKPQALRFQFSVNVPKGAVVKDFGAVFSNSEQLGGLSDNAVFKDTDYNVNDTYGIDSSLLAPDSAITKGSVSLKDGTLKNYTAKTISDDEVTDISSGENAEYNITFNMAVTGISNTHYCSSRIARSYVTYELYSHTYTVFDDCVIARNINYVADMVLNSSTETQYVKDYVKNNILIYQ